MAKRKGFVTISLPEDMVDEIDELIGKEERSYKSRPEFVKDAIRRRLDEIRSVPPRFEHINPDGDFPSDSVKIWDRQSEGRGRVVEVYFRREGARCDYCEKEDCIHVRYVWTIPYLSAQLTKHGVKSLKTARE